MEPFIPHSRIFFFNHTFLYYFLIKKEHVRFTEFYFLIFLNLINDDFLLTYFSFHLFREKSTFKSIYNLYYFYRFQGKKLPLMPENC